MRFSDEKYVQDYHERGIFPAIHNDIFAVANKRARRVPIMDLGSCTGLLSVRLVEKASIPLVIGVEASAAFIERSVNNSRVRYKNIRVDSESLDALKSVILENQVQTVIARRVFPEIAETGGVSLVRKVASIFAQAGVGQIITEGRKPNSRATNPLSDVSKEVKALSGHYKPLTAYKDVVELKVRA